MADDDAPEAPSEDGKTFTQADLDRLIEDRLKRERAKYADYSELKAKAAKLDEVDNASKSDVERATARAEAAEKRATEAEARAMRLEVASAKGLTAAQAKRLVGTTLEELEADADELLSTFAADAPKDPPPAKPAESLGGGGDPTQEPEPDIRQVVDSIPRGF